MVITRIGDVGMGIAVSDGSGENAIGSEDELPIRLHSIDLVKELRKAREQLGLWIFLVDEMTQGTVVYTGHRSAGFPVLQICRRPRSQVPGWVCRYSLRRANLDFVEEAYALGQHLSASRKVDPTDEAPEGRVHVCAPRGLKGLARYGRELALTWAPLHEPRALKKTDACRDLQSTVDIKVVHAVSSPPTAVLSHGLGPSPYP